ncbi:hypothetical protein CMUS01_01771 [Colletotrichum musicola]|uniref:Uncharacterized protein n=1 Tax=Colletotrichum musicola TaxID=2175873 RepID=A0A8H6U853_9PEZI|nr:hypothetical protein CMUS01_01771 [Colletotrichum musicola]
MALTTAVPARAHRVSPPQHLIIPSSLSRPSSPLRLSAPQPMQRGRTLAFASEALHASCERAPAGGRTRRSSPNLECQDKHGTLRRTALKIRPPVGTGREV